MIPLLPGFSTHYSGKTYIMGCSGLLILCFFIMFMAPNKLTSSMFLISTIITSLIIYFFRIPDNLQIEKVLSSSSEVLSSPGSNFKPVIAPSYGTIIDISDQPLPDYLEIDTTARQRIVTFLSVLDPHINFIPVSGTVKKIYYKPGKFFNALSTSASTENERNYIIIETDEGEEFVIVQIAGLIARRIVCDIKEGDRVKAGDIFGIIKFSSRVDLYLPLGASIKGDTRGYIKKRLIGGVTRFCNFES